MSELSYWFQEVPDKKRFPTLEGNLKCDVGVIGGGMAGISAAYFLSRASVKTALVEMGNLVTGDTGYTTAFATHFLDSVEATLRAWPASETGIQLFRELIKKEKIACDWEDIDGVGFTKKEDTLEFLQDFNRYRETDSTLEYFTGDNASQVVGFPVKAAFRKKQNEGQFHVRKFLLGLADQVVKNGAEIFEGNEVVDLTREKSITIRTEKGSIEAQQLIVASGPPPRQFFPAIYDKLTGAITYVIQATYEEAKPFGRSLFWDDLEPYHYFRWVDDTNLILGGEDRYLKDKPSGNPHDNLKSWLESVSPGSPFKVVNQWQGTIFYTPDILPWIGPHQDYGENVIFLTGWAGNGMAHGLLAGQIAADLVQRKKNPYQSLFSFKGRTDRK